MTKEEFKNLRPGDIVKVTTTYEVEASGVTMGVTMTGRGFGTLAELNVGNEFEPLVDAMQIVETVRDRKRRERYEQYLQLKEEFESMKADKQ